MAKAILSSDKVHTLHHTFYDPKSTVKATLLVAHGMAEHSGRYQLFAEHLANNGIAVLTYDHLGHGRTIHSADEMGFFDKKHPVQVLLKDVIIMANHLKQRHPEVPHFIMGHSMGSFIVREVLKNHSSEFAGTILMGTSNGDPLAKVMLPPSKLLNRLKPFQKNIVYGKIMNTALNSKLKDKQSDSQYAWVCKNPEALKRYESDPLCAFDFTNNGYWALFNLMNTALAKDWAETIATDFPMLFVSGKNDPIGNMGKGIRKLTKRLKKEGFTDVRKVLYKDMRHEPLHETDNQQVYDDITSWLLDHSKEM